MHHRFHVPQSPWGLGLKQCKRVFIPVLIFLLFVGVAPRAAGSNQLSAAPGSLNFGNVTVNAGSTLAVTLSYSGNNSVSVSQITVSGNGFSVATPSLPLTLASGQNVTLEVTFDPTASGCVTGRLSLFHSAKNLLAAVSLSGTGVTPPAVPSANLSTTTLGFANQPVNTTSSAQTFTLTNAGSAALALTSITLTGANPGYFAQTNNCGSSVAAGGYCTVSVTFTPAASGTWAAAVSIADNASGNPQSVRLSGTGTAAVASLSSNTLAFGGQPVDTTSAAQVLTLTNTGNASLTVTSLAFTGANPADFAESDTCGGSLAAGAHCTIAILFTPAAAGACSAALSIAYNANGSPQTVSLSGAGSHDVILAWTDSATPGVIGYNVYRGTASGGESSTPLNSTPINASGYTDGNVADGMTYYYVVTAVASNGQTQSPASNEAAATVP